MLAKSSKISMAKIENKCGEVTGLLRALSHPGRLLIMGHLIEGEKTVTALQELCAISQSQLSQFLTRMKLEGLVKCRRMGRYQFYSAADTHVVKLIEAIQSIYCR